MPALVVRTVLSFWFWFWFPSPPVAFGTLLLSILLPVLVYTNACTSLLGPTGPSSPRLPTPLGRSCDLRVALGTLRARTSTHYSRLAQLFETSIPLQCIRSGPLSSRPRETEASVSQVCPRAARPAHKMSRIFGFYYGKEAPFRCLPGYVGCQFASVSANFSREGRIGKSQNPII